MSGGGSSHIDYVLLLELSILPLLEGEVEIAAVWLEHHVALVEAVGIAMFAHAPEHHHGHRCHDPVAIGKSPDYRCKPHIPGRRPRPEHIGRDLFFPSGSARTCAKMLVSPSPHGTIHNERTSLTNLKQTKWILSDMIK